MVSKPLVCSTVRPYRRYFQQLQDYEVQEQTVFVSGFSKETFVVPGIPRALDWVHIIYGIIVRSLPRTTKTYLAICRKHTLVWACLGCFPPDYPRVVWSITPANPPAIPSHKKTHLPLGKRQGPCLHGQESRPLACKALFSLISSRGTFDRRHCSSAAARPSVRSSHQLEVTSAHGSEGSNVTFLPSCRVAG